MRPRVVGLVLSAFLATGCGAKAASTADECQPVALSNCPQDTLPAPDAGECALPPIAGVQGFFIVGCVASVQCTYETQTCVCEQTARGPDWGCNF